MKFRMLNIVWFFFSICIFSQTDYTPERFRILFNKLGNLEFKSEILLQNNDLVKLFKATIGSDTLEVKQMLTSNGYLYHLGINLLNKEQFLSDNYYLHFLERFLLEKMLSVSANSFYSEVNFEIDGKYLNSDYLSNFLNGGKTSIDFIEDNKNAEILMKTDNESLKLKFPKKISIITGLDKNDLDMLVYYRINSKYSSHLGIEEKPVLNSIFPGIDNKTNDGSNSEEEIWKNLFLSPNNSEKEVVLLIDQKIYPNEFIKSEVNLKKLNNIFGLDYKSYVGIEQQKEGVFTVNVFYKNEKLNNLHILVCKVGNSYLKQKKIKFSAELYTNIRTDNIKNYFKSEEEKSPKYKLRLNPGKL